jgi:hypothetical protein
VIQIVLIKGINKKKRRKAPPFLWKPAALFEP